ncbi:hypothetical protein SAMN06265338_102166 [Rhodoblastus acidophilus]|uniref:Uncharacterized protein n=1 Tax=Rhodoblastus acidophilus TaxID=1074 RepID=A0A212QZN8_RHOAC|nr:transposase [Rhodoblastus acidophilus]PPQ40521.1 hypothetical protein CKO16_01900 [Rhodoblastus acidophilus]RAI18643.1 hypothetical protein CH337_13765 [Rhodoblastus acidophilus]SNB65191.1 hypothetical protein SAMN06265338_102166 [Rhodoblastus acidophilus]
MISVVLLSPSLVAAAPDPRAAEALARSLGSLVRATMEGVVRDAALIGPACDDLAAVADYAGCAHIEADTLSEGWARALSETRGDVVFALEGGYAPQTGFIEEASDLLLEGANFAGALLRRAPYNLATRFAPGLARPVGVLAQRGAVRTAQARDLNALVRHARPSRTLNVRAIRMV